MLLPFTLVKLDMKTIEVCGRWFPGDVRNGLATPTVSANILFPLLRGGMSAVDDDHFPVGLVGLHDAMSLTDFVEAKDPRRLGVEPASRNVLGDFLRRTSESGKPGVPNTKLPKKVR
jgi:hypothetical protein